MKAAEIIDVLEALAPPSLQESYDNSGLLVGNPQTEVTSVLLSLDCTEEVIDEALAQGSNMLICHHPLIFGSLKSITGKDWIERCLIKAIKNDLLIYAIHTNLDNVMKGVNHKLAEVIGLQNCRILRPMKGQLTKLVFFVPTKQAEAVRQAVFAAGAGEIGNYSNCSFNLEGKGSFKAASGSNPHVGEVGELHFEQEERVEVILPNYLRSKIIKAMIKAHPYEEVAYDLYALQNSWEQRGSGMIGELKEEIEVDHFLKELKSKLNAGAIRYTKPPKSKLKKVAICGGSGSFLLKDAIKAGADIFITGDFKYHQFFDADGEIMIADVGHFESEQYTGELIRDYLNEKLKDLSCNLSQVDTNPINYFT